MESKLLDKDLVDYALEYAKNKKIEYAEARAQSQNREEIVLKNGILEAYSIVVNSGLCVRILTENGLGFASSNKWTREEAKEIVDTALKMANSAKRKTKIKFVEEKAVKTSWKVQQKKKKEDISPEAKIDKLMEIDKTLITQSINIPARMLSCNIALTQKYFVNSEGTMISSFVPSIGMYTFITIVENGKPEQAYKQYGYSGGWEAQDKWKVAEDLVREAKALQKLIKEGKTVSPSKMDLVCGPEVVGIAAHESCGHPMEADRILGREMSQAGKSFIYEGGPFWLGTKIGSAIVTIIDDPTIKNSYGYYEYDDEGIKARPRYLYKNGVINEFLHNRETAAKMGTKSNGASRAINYDREAIVRMANTFVQPGDMSEDEIFEDVKHGIYMKSFTEWNIDDRRFNQRYVGREAYLIEKGELTTPIARPIIETTTKTFWTAVDAITKTVVFDSGTCGKGDPMQGMPVYMGGPMIRLRGVFVK